MGEYAGTIVEFLDGDTVRVAFVLSETATKLQAVNPQGKTLRLSPKQVIISHGQSDQSGWKDDWREIETRVEGSHNSLDTELLWESVRDDAVTEWGLAELAALYFGETDSTANSALLRALLEDAIHFRRKGVHFCARTVDQVRQTFEEQQKHAEKEAYLERVADWMEHVLQNSGPQDVPPDMERAAHEIEVFLSGGHPSHAVQCLFEIPADVREFGTFAFTDSAREKAYVLLKKTNRLPADADPFLISAGVVADFPDDVTRSVGPIVPYVPCDSRRDYTGLETVTIDDDTTRELDDAVSVQALDRGLRVVIHVADISSFVQWGDPADEEAYRRAVSLYLPHRTVTMFPERLACRLASLNEGELRPTVSVELDFDAEGRLDRRDLCLGQIVVNRRLSYDEADSLLGDPMSGSLASHVAAYRSASDFPASMLVVLDALTRALMEERIRRGALVIRRPDLKIQAGNGEISLKTIDPDTVSRRIVSELMIAANCMAAEYAGSASIPIIYRVMDQPGLDMDLPASGYDPVQVDRMLRSSKKSRFSVYPQRHGGLGVDSYTRFTSPIRRYADLSVQRQFAFHLSGLPPPLDSDGLFQVLATAEEAESRMHKIEASMNRRHILEYLRRYRIHDEFHGIVTDDSSRTFEIELCDLFIRGDLPADSRLALGDLLAVVIEAVDPRTNVLRFRVVRSS